MSLIAELQRRNVIKVALLYVVASWLILQVGDVLFEQLGLPEWAFRFVFGLLVICFPLVLLFSWVFEITPEGIKRESQVEAEQSITGHTGRRINRVIVVLLVLAILTVVADRLIPEPTPARVTAAAGQAEPSSAETVIPSEVSDKSIAVLPFVNMSGDEENEYFSDGLTEELLNSLARIDALKVAGRTSSFVFKGQHQDLREIAEALDVAHLLEGSVRKAGNRVRITAQLIKASDGYHLWSETFDRELDDIFEIQEEIAGRVAAALQATLLGTASASAAIEQTDDAEAWESYLRGNYLFQKARDDEEMRKRAEAEFLHALNLDPNFELARWGLFQILDFRHRNGAVDYEKGLELMTEAANAMLERAPDLPESHLAAGRAAVTRIEIAKARDAFLRALDMQPGSVEAMSQLGGVESLMGNTQRASELLGQALQLDPLSPTLLIENAYQHMRLGQCGEVARLRSRILTIEPESGRINAIMAACLLVGDEKLSDAIDLASAEPVEFLRHTLLAIALHKQGDTDRAAAELQAMTEQYGDSASYQYAQVYAHWGEADKATEWLAKAWETKDPGAINLLRDPLIEPIRQHSGYLKLRRQYLKKAGMD